MAFKYVNLEEAKVAAAQWDANLASVEHIENFSSSVFKFSNRSGNAHILRFVDHEQRTFAQVLGELEFLTHLQSKNVRSSAPEPSIDGALAIPFEASSGLQTCSSMAYVNGLEITDTSTYWNEIYYREWGRNLASIHRASRAYFPAVPKRWRWDEEHLMLNFSRLIPQEDSKSRGLFKSLIEECQSLIKTEVNFGLIHADHAPNNLIFDPTTSLLTAIDFGNCCYHWYLADLAIALSVVRRKENREEIRAALLESYAETEQFPADHERLLDLFIRQRVMYVYLDRLHRYGANPSQEENSILNQCREKVHANTGWG